MSSPAWKIGSGQSIGARQRQEDALGVYPEGSEPRVLVLSDGMGGAAGGDIASRLVVDAVLHGFNEQQGSGDHPGRLLASGARLANRAIRQAAKDNPDLEGMGATLVGVALVPHGFVFFSMGDSPLWLVRGSRITRLNTDHSIGGLLDAAVGRGELTAAAADARKDRNTITSVIMGEPIDRMHRDECVDVVPVQRDDVLILASDGLDTLSEDMIVDICRSTRQSPQQTADALLERVGAEARPRQDNVSVIVARR